MSDSETIQEIVSLKRALERDSDASDSDADDIGEAYSNRGNKLKKGARGVASSRLWAPEADTNVKLVQFGGRKHAIISRSKHYHSYNPYNVDLDDADGSDGLSADDEELLDEVDLEGLLRPITDPAEVPNHPSIGRTFQSENLQAMAKETLDIIVQEKSHVTKLGNLLSSLLGDDPAVLDVHNMHLVDYESVDDGPAISQTPASENDSKVGITSVAQANRQTTASNGIVGTRRQNSRAQPAVDRFFAPPDLMIDRDFGIAPEAAEETRQLLQIAHQRLEEFVRCMTKIRMGFTKTDRRRRQVLNWCKELNGQDYVEEEIGLDETHLQWGMSKPIRQAQMDSHQSGTERSDN